MTCYLGVDLTSSERRASAWAALDESAHILEMALALTEADIEAVAERMQPASVAIDSPLFLPRGLSTLDDLDAARGLPTGRACERALKQIGIGCFYTTPQSIIKSMVYRGIALRRRLEEKGVIVLEVFPYASKVRLFGRRSMPNKTRLKGRRWLHEQLARYIPDVAARDLPSHDDMDALVAAYTGLLHGQERAEALGDPEEGVLWLPCVGALLAASTAP